MKKLLYVLLILSTSLGISAKESKNNIKLTAAIVKFINPESSDWILEEDSEEFSSKTRGEITNTRLDNSTVHRRYHLEYPESSLINKVHLHACNDANCDEHNHCTLVIHINPEHVEEVVEALKPLGILVELQNSEFTINDDYTECCSAYKGSVLVCRFPNLSTEQWDEVYAYLDKKAAKNPLWPSKR